jgi:hypothetical protein
VSVQFKASIFASWWLAVIALSALAGHLFGSLACISVLVAAIPVTLFASVHVFPGA